MRNGCLLALCCCMFWSPTALAQRDDDDRLKVGDPAPDFEAEDWINLHDGFEPSKAELNGMVIVVFFTSATETAESAWKQVNALANNPGLGENTGVYVLGITDAPRRTMEKLARDNKIFFPIGCGSKVAEEYGIDVTVGFVVIDADGDLTYRSGDQLSSQGLVGAIGEALSDTPPSKTHPRNATRVRDDLKKVRGMIRDGKYREAYRKCFTPLDGTYAMCVTGDPLKSEVTEIRDLLEAVALERMDDIPVLLEEEDFTEAADTLRWVTSNFAGLAPANRARGLYKTYQEKFDGFKEAVEAHAADDEAAKLYFQAIEDLRGYRFGDGYDKAQRIVSEYSKSPAAPHARGLIGRMKANANFWSQVKDHLAKSDCEQWLSEARILLNRGRRSEARRLLERILREYPDTKFEQEARKLLIRL